MKKNYLIKYYFISCFIFLSIISAAQAPVWGWARSASGGIDWDYATSIAVDGAGNCYTTGYFLSPSLTFGSTTLTSANGITMFLVKHDASGNVLWAKSANTHAVYGCAVAVDALGNSYVTGAFDGPTVTFGSFTLTNSGDADVFLVKYDANGNVLWAKSASGIGYDAGSSVCVNANGNISITGFFDSPTIIFGSDTLANAGSRNVFIVNYDVAGNVQWAKNSSTYIGEGASIAIDALGNNYVAGSFDDSTITFGSVTLTNFFSAGYGTDMFLVKYDVSGNVLWAKSTGGIYNDQANSVAVDSSGNSFVTGSFYSPTIIFGSSTLTNVDNSGNTDDLFLAKFDSSGNIMWAKSAGGSANDDAYSVAVSVAGDSYVTGGYDSPTISFGSTTLTLVYDLDLFLAKYDVAGNLVWAKSNGGIGGEACNSVAVDALDNCYVAGSFNSPTISFDPDTLSDVNNFNHSSDVFIAKTDKLIGMNSLVAQNKIVSVFPNPSSGIFNIAMNTNEFLKPEIEIYDVDGKIVFKSEILNPKSKIDLSGNANGIYFYKIFNATEIIDAGKIIVAE